MYVVMAKMLSAKPPSNLGVLKLNKYKVSGYTTRKILDVLIS